MYIERLQMLYPEQTIIDSRVGDVAFDGARVDWSRVMRADKAFIRERLDAVLTTWFEGHPPADLEAWRLSGLPRDGGESADYRLEYVTRGEEETWIEAAFDDTEARAVVVEELRSIVAVVYGMLLIWDEDEDEDDEAEA